jgi:hypothetical protein
MYFACVQALARAQSAGAVDAARLARVDTEPAQWLTVLA